MTLKFKTKKNHCQIHKSSDNFFLNCLPKSLSSLIRPKSMNFKRNSTHISQNDESFLTRLKNHVLNSENPRSSATIDDQSLIEDLNSTCVKCMAEDKHLVFNVKSREDLYKTQPSSMFEYHIGMCFLIFISILAVLIISDLKK